MKADGCAFRLSANRVWLVGSVPAKCERNQAHLAGRPKDRDESRPPIMSRCPTSSSRRS